MAKIVILVEKDFQDLEVYYPYYRLKEEGFDVVVAGTGENSYKGKFGLTIQADANIKDLDPAKFDVVVIPGGWAPDHLRWHEPVKKFVSAMNKNGKIVAGICHAASVLVSADVLRGKKATCYKAVKDDLVNAGATFFDKEVVVDGNLITSRIPDDLPAFCKAIIASVKNK